jgi:hypothetical protein
MAMCRTWGVRSPPRSCHAPVGKLGYGNWGHGNSCGIESWNEHFLPSRATSSALTPDVCRHGRARHGYTALAELAVALPLELVPRWTKIVGPASDAVARDFTQSKRHLRKRHVHRRPRLCRARSCGCLEHLGRVAADVIHLVVGSDGSS